MDCFGNVFMVSFLLGLKVKSAEEGRNSEGSEIIIIIIKGE